jgi:DNA processing protein
MAHMNGGEMKDLAYWIWLSRIPGLGPKNLFKLINKYQSPEIIWNLKEKELIENRISQKVSRNILDDKYRKNLDKYIEYMKNNHIELITIYDQHYPKKLKNIYDFPVILYVKGNKEILNDLCIGIIGCRDASKYGERISKEFAYTLSKHNINIISGLARGIDSFAHIGCMAANGKTIAVLGSGIDYIYPPENKIIYEEIIRKQGIIISEYIMGTKPLAGNFPARNRIISGISSGLIVVEAKEKSGTLITVDFALEQGKEIYVVPGNIDSPNSSGTNELIKQGAQIITSPEDILKSLNILKFS